MENVKLNSVQLPFFDGFYESFYTCEIDNIIENQIEYYKDEGKEYDWDDFVIDDGWKQECITCFIEEFKSVVPDFVISLEYDDLWSPQWYNYTTDKVYCNMVLKPTWQTDVTNFFNEHKDQLKKIIHDYHTSCDGFISFMSNDFDDWIEELNKPIDELDDMYFTCALKYIIFINSKEETIGGIECWLNSGAVENADLYQFVHLEQEQETETK